MSVKRSILLIDDDYRFHRKLEAMLRSGYEFISAYNRIEGLELIQSKRPDVVLLDLHLPSVLTAGECSESLGLLGEIAALGDGKPPVLVLAEANAQAEAVRFMREGATGVIAKPVGLGLLISRIEDCLTSTSQKSDGRTPQSK